MTEDPDFSPFPAADPATDGNAALGANVDVPAAKPATKPRGRPRKAAVRAGNPPALNEAPVPSYIPPLDPASAPAYVRHRKTGMVTRWTPVFRDRIDQFDVFYRPGTDDAAKHRLLVQRVETTRTLLGGGVLNAAQGAFSQSTVGG